MSCHAFPRIPVMRQGSARFRRALPRDIGDNKNHKNECRAPARPHCDGHMPTPADRTEATACIVC